MQHKPSPRHVIVLPLLLALAWPVTTSAQSETQPEVPSSDAASTVMGKQSFRSYCASCHGTEARGDGSIAEHLKVPPADLTRISQRNDGEFPFDKVFQTIDGRLPARGHGNRDMPVWGDAFKMTRDNPDEAAVKDTITALVNFLQSIQED